MCEYPCWLYSDSISFQRSLSVFWPLSYYYEVQTGVWKEVSSFVKYVKISEENEARLTASEFVLQQCSIV